MPERVDDWIAKADGDFNVADREFSRRGKRNFDATGSGEPPCENMSCPRDECQVAATTLMYAVRAV